LTNDQIVAEMKWTEKAFMAVTGLKLKYMRPPFGDIDNRVRFILNKMGYIPVDWTNSDFDTNDWNMPNITEASIIAQLTKTLDAYVATPKTTGFYCLEHDLNNLTVAAAQKLIPLGQERKIQISNVAVCQKDATPYQSGGTAPMPTVSGVATTAPLPGASPSSSAPAGKSNGVEKTLAAKGLFSVAAVLAVIGAIIA